MTYHPLIVPPTAAQTVVSELLRYGRGHPAYHRPMPSATKRSTGPRRKPETQPAVENATKVEQQPFLRFHHSVELRERTLLVLAAIETEGDPTAHRDALADIIVELSNAGLDAYFLKPLERANLGFVVQKSANLGLAGAQRVLGSVTRNIVGRMDPTQLRSVCSSVRELMR